MSVADTLYAVESEKSVSEFVKDFDAVVEANDFVINNKPKMNMKETFTSLGGEVPEDFDFPHVPTDLYLCIRSSGCWSFNSELSGEKTW